MQAQRASIVTVQGKSGRDPAASPSQDSWSAPSPTQTLGHSSPELPPLPTLPSLGGLPRTPLSASKPPADDAAYFTTSWGSPYQAPPPGLKEKSTRHNRDTFVSGDEFEDEPSPKFGLDHLIPNRLENSSSPKLRFGLDHLLPKRLPFLKQDPSSPTLLAESWQEKEQGPAAGSSKANQPQLFFPKEPTERWIKQFLTGQWQSEKANWWSDGSTEDESDKESPAAGDPKRRSKAEGSRKKRKGHKSRKSNLTLKQADFWAQFGQKGRETIEKMMASRFADPQPPMAPETNDTDPKAEILFDADARSDVRSLSSRHGPEPPSQDKAAAPPRPPPKDTLAPPASRSRPSSPANSRPGSRASSPAPSRLAPPTALRDERPPPPPKVADTPKPRPKKRVLWRGRNIVIQVPQDHLRGTPMGPPRPMTSGELEQRLKDFERAGYSTRGFDTADGSEQESTALSQARAIFPDIEEEAAQWKSTKKTNIHIPDKAEWERYVNFLTEQKLAALGVSLGGDEPADDPTSASRSASAQFLAFSPQTQPASVGSSGFGAVSAPFQLPSGPSPGISGHMSRTSIASPISPFGNARPSGHLSRHSTYASPANVPQQQPTPPLAGISPSLFMGHNAFRGGSPAMPTSNPSLGHIASPVSPYGSQQGQQFPFPHSNDVFAQMQQQQQHLQAQLLQQQQQQQQQLFSARPQSTLDQLPEEDFEEEERAQERPRTPPRPGQIQSHNHNIVVPTPRGGHRHNISENLEREIRDAEYHLEQAIDRQLDEDGEFGTGNKYGVHSPLDKPIQANGYETMWQSNQSEAQDSSFPEHLGGPGPVYHERGDEDAKTTISDAGTNPSFEGQNDRSTATAGTSSSQQTFGSSQYNNSSLHVSHSSQGSIKSTASKLNVNAKEFKFNPGASPASSNTNTFQFEPMQPQNEQHTQAPPPSRGNSKLHAAVPSFVPSFKVGGFGTTQPQQTLPSMPRSTFDFSAQGPAFKSDATSAQQSASASLPSSNATGQRLFNIDIQDADVVKPARRSKAIPIIRPDPNQQAHTDEETLDESGRPVQAEWRQKKARRGGQNVDDEPQFARPHILPSNAPPQPLGDATFAQNAVRSDLPRPTVSPIPEGKENQTPDSRTPQPSTSDNNAQSMFELPMQSQSASSHQQGSKSSLNPPGSDFDPSVFNFGLHVTKPSMEINRDDQTIGAGLHEMSRSPAPTNTYQPSEGGSFMTALEPNKPAPYGDSEIEERPTFDEIDDVMRAMNDQGSEYGVLKETPPWTRSSPLRRQQIERPEAALFRSPSPNPAQHLYPSTGVQDSPSAQDPFSDSKAGLAYDSPVHRLNDHDDVPVSDWDDIVSTDEEAKVQARSRFFDHHVDNIIDSVLQSRLGPLEKSIYLIRDSVSALTVKQNGRSLRRSPSIGTGESDADDEDDELAPFHRARSPGRNRKFEKIKSVVAEALSQHIPSQPEKNSGVDFAEFYQALSDLKVSVARSTSTGQLDDLREIMEEALNRQSIALIDAKRVEANAEVEAKIAELESTLDENKQLLEVATESRRIAEGAEQDAQRRLALAEEELQLFRAQVRDDDQRMRSMTEGIHDLKLSLQSSERDQEELRRRLVTLETQNEALEATLDEYRLSSKKWHAEIQQANEDNEVLRRNISTLEAQNHESIRGREKMRAKLEQLQKDMVSAASQVAEEKSKWQRQEEDHVKRYETLRARIEAEARTRERFEREMERLEAQEREGMRLKVVLEQTQRQILAIEQTANKFRLESLEFQKRAERFEREFHESREAARAEIKRTRVLMEADLEAANNQVNVVRAELESENSRLRQELDSVRLEWDTEKARHEMLLESEADSKRDAVRDAHEGRDRALKDQQHRYEKAMEEQQQRYERTLEEQQQRYEKEIQLQQQRVAQKMEDQQRRYEKDIEDLHRQHNRDLAMTIEDKQHAEEHLNDRLSLANEKVDYLQDKILHLEEKLEVAKSAAHAAALAAQSVRSPVASSHESALPSAQDKVSPQALRESIVVLQEQLQEREQRIERLEQQLQEVGPDSPQRVKQMETEIGWLRELLGVRIDDITDLINALATPNFDREIVQNAAIRIRTNLQMEQQEKERLIAGGGNMSFPALASISNFASPKAAQLAAAFGSWRKNRESVGANNRLSGASGQEQTPSRNLPSTSGLLSGLMTPPTSASRTGKMPQRSSIRPRGTSFTSESGRYSGRAPSSAVQADPRLSDGPSTPPRSRDGLLHKGAYDQDAEDSSFSPSGFDYDESSRHEGLSIHEVMTMDRNLASMDMHDHEALDGMRPFEPFGGLD
ncbi:hypothetical protein HDK90DRAFT_479434 [Phyllosticta capitalensis]|uniref:Myosin class II heavy chain n=1 Tax=Phyllosticta capitalensis TaxID=121624 RepID=A0ABR1YVX3_9PEZI